MLVAQTLLSVVLLAQTGAPEPQTDPDLQRIRGDIAKLKQKLEDVKTQTQSAEQQLEEVGIELDIRNRELELATRVERDLDKQAHGLQDEVNAVKGRIEDQKVFLSHRLGALYRLGRLSYARLLLSIDDRRDPLQGVSMLTYLASRDARAISRFQGDVRLLGEKQATLAVKQRNVGEARKIVLMRQQAVAAAHAKQVKLVAQLHHQSEQSEQQIANLEEKAKRLERLIDLLVQQSAGNPVVEDIRGFEGALGWPVEGTVTESFGRQVDPKFSTVTFNNGLKIAAPPGAEVRSVFTGTVLFSQWFKGYGNLIILDHGNRVVSLYGNLKSPTVAVGDHVRAGQALAGVGEAEEAQTGFLYFEIRQDNKPDDPRKWLR